MTTLFDEATLAASSIRVLSSGDSALAHARPPIWPPLGRFGTLLGASSTSPVAMRPIDKAFCTVSAWRFSALGTFWHVHVLGFGTDAL
jgi:hypothetical protein